MPDANILIVEDERIIARELKTDLEEMGYTVTGMVNSGEKAIQHVQEINPDLVLMDIRLRSKMDGIETASQIFTRFKTPVIFISAFTDDTLIGRAKKVGSFGYLVKPYEKRELYACIEMAVYKAQTEKKIEVTEKYSRAIFEQSPLSIQVFDKNGLTLNVNRAWSELWQRPPDAVIGKYNILEDEEARKTGLSDLIAAAFDGGTDFIPEFRYDSTPKGDAGDPRFIKCLVFPVKDVNDRVHKVVLMHEDVTLHKQAETDRYNLEKQTQRAQRMETVATLAGGIAHQFENALFAITGSIELLEPDYTFDDKTAEHLRRMKDSANRMANLTRQLLAYAGGGNFRTQTVSLNAFLKETLPLVKYTLDSPVYTDSNNCARLYVTIDPTQIQMVLSAVLTNASEAIEGNEGRIQVDCRKFVLTDKNAGDFPGLELGDYACLTITDDGRGMDEKTRAHIFEPFFTTNFQGRGMGMAAVYGIIKNHGGRITIASESGRGTTVNIYLPTVVTPAPKQASPKPESLKSLGTILVIEDEEPVMFVNRAILESLGCRVMEAQTGQEAIDIVKTFDGDIDLAMLDFLLPDINGDEVYPLLMEARPDLKVIVVSSFAIDEPIRKIMDAGAQGFIQKPFSISKLAKQLKLILEAE